MPTPARLSGQETRLPKHLTSWIADLPVHSYQREPAQVAVSVRGSGDLGQDERCKAATGRTVVVAQQLGILLGSVHARRATTSCVLGLANGVGPPDPEKPRDRQRDANGPPAVRRALRSRLVLLATGYGHTARDTVHRARQEVGYRAGHPRMPLTYMPLMYPSCTSHVTEKCPAIARVTAWTGVSRGEPIVLARPARATAPRQPGLRATAATADEGSLSHGIAPRTTVVARRLRWRHAEQTAAQITPAEQETLVTLIRVPLASVMLLEQLGGLWGGAAVYRRLARLRAAGLVAELRPLIQPRYSPALLYVTDLGLATIAVSDRRDPVEVARRFRVRGSDLLGRLPGLPTLLASYRLLGALATAGPGWPNLRNWEQPCRLRFQTPAAKTLTRLELPARASLAWDDRSADYLLIPDLGTCHLRIYRPMLHQVHALRRAGGEPPRLVIATVPRRAGAWEALLEDVDRSRRDAPLPAWIACWNTLDADLEKLFDAENLKPASCGDSASLPQTPRLVVRCPDAAIPRTVGDLTADAARPRTLAARLGRLALELTPSDVRMLDVVSRHPFLPLPGLAAALGWSTNRARRRRDDLIRRGLARLLPANTSRGATLELAELTVKGLRFAAARLGFPLSVAVKMEGLTGGGPSQPIGSRQSLSKNLTHTLGANAVFTHLQSSAARTIKRGGDKRGDDELVVWDGPGACSRGRVRPDGRGVYRRGGQLFYFFLEYDRGTSGIRPLLRKLNAYFEYLETGRFRQDYPCFPIVLVVTTSNAAEARFARAAWAASVGRYTRLPLLLTATWRIFDDPTNQDGLLGTIWREPDAPFHQRRRWLEDAPRPAGR